MNGFERELKQRVLGVLPHLIIRGREPLSDWTKDAAIVAGLPGVTGVAPVISGTGLLVANGHSKGVAFNGIDPERETEVSDLARYIKGGGLGSLSDGSFSVVVGRGVGS